MHFTDKKCQLFNNTVYDKIIRYGQINATMAILQNSERVQNNKSWRKRRFFYKFVTSRCDLEAILVYTATANYL